jgi:hypothetical protein
VIIGYDESHCEHWTIGDSLASRISPDSPERHAYSHLAQLASEFLGAESRRVLRSWQGSSLANIDVLVVPEPEFSGEADDDIRAVTGHVARGMGLLCILGEAGGEALDRINSLIGRFGIHATRQEIHSRHPRYDYLDTHRVVCDSVASHQVTAGVRKVTCHHGISIECDDGATPLIRAEDGSILLAVAAHGAGRIAVIGSAESFAAPFVGQEDNALVFLNALIWLAGGAAGIVDKQEISNVMSSMACTAGTVEDCPDSLEDSALVIDVRPQRDALRAAYRSRIDPYEDPERFIQEALLAFHELPIELRRKVVDFKRNSNDFGALVIKGLPGDPNLPSTPARSREIPKRSTYLSEFWLAVFASPLGDPIGYYQEKSGAIFQNVVPVKENADKLSSESSEDTLDFHTETAFHPQMPDYLLLYCLRPDPDRQAATLIAGSRMMIPQVPLKYRPILFDPAFRTGIDYSFGSPSGQVGNGPVMSILRGDPFDPLMKLDPDLMIGLEPDADAALNAMKAAIKAAGRSIFLEESDLIIVDNHRAIHGRSKFRAYYDGQDRWLQRMYVLSDLGHVVEGREAGGRVIRARFAL